ncbi:MAG: rod shape-determining protein MreC [Bryobacteraceae bacterium]|nr:rod shape-determining protein MreC [Bryobacteraceae bacterium]
MEALLNRYRNLTILLLVILAQLVLLAYQVKSNQDVRLIRVWAVTAVTPMARVLEFLREHTIGVAENYFVLVNVRAENERVKAENGRLKIENQFLKTELQTADRAQALASFQQRTPSRTLPARIIGTGTGADSRVVFIDRGSGSGILRGMAVITPEGIVGKVLASYPTASQVLLITDPTFAAGVISDKNRIHGTVKGIGQSKVMVDHVQNEEKVEVGETFYTSGDDRIFPKGMPVGRVTVVREGRAAFKDIFLVPAGFGQGLEEVLVVIEGVNGTIPDPQAEKNSANPEVYLQPQAPVTTSAPGTGAPVAESTGTTASSTANLTTDADRVREKYKQIGEQQGIKFGEGNKIADFNAPLVRSETSPPKPVPAKPAPAKPSAAKPSAAQPAPVKPQGQTSPVP